MLPQGMFSVAVATVLFPTLARLASRGDMAGFRVNVSRGFRQIVFLLVPAAVVSAVLAEPIIRILFQRGAWTRTRRPWWPAALAAFSAGLVFNGTMLMLNRAFFSLQSNWIPTVVALGNLFLNALLDLAFYRFGIWGIPLSTTVVNIAGTVALFVLLRRRLGRLDGRAIALSDPQDRGCLPCRRRGRLRGLGAPRRRARALVPGPGSIARSGAGAARSPSTSALAGCCG